MPPVHPRPCACGCGQLVTAKQNRTRYLPGHYEVSADGKAAQARGGRNGRGPVKVRDMAAVWRRRRAA